MHTEQGDQDSGLPELGSVDPPPCRPPLEIIERGGEWVMEEYRDGARDGPVFGTFDGRLDAMQATRERMAAEVHPCIVRWDAEDIVGGLYWNDLFERLEVRYDELLDAWVIVPAVGHFLFQAGRQHDTVVEYARAVRQRYDFKHLALYTAEDELVREDDHRFLRHSLAESGVRFDREKLLAHEGPTASDGDSTDDTDAQTDRPTNSLTAVVGGYEQLDLDGETRLLQYYTASWTDGQPARIVALKPELADERLREAFLTGFDRWQQLQQHPHVASILGHGDSPSQWIAYDPGQASLAALAEDLGLDARLDVLEHVATALDTATRMDVPPTGLRPAAIRVGPQDGMAHATLAEWGLGHELRQVGGETPIGWHTAPEQLQGTTVTTTGVYQLGALAYWLVCDTVPFADASSLESAIETGSRRSPSEVAAVSEDVDDFFDRAMALQPHDRYTRAGDFCDELRGVLQS
jgi:hypothetical protein